MHGLESGIPSVAGVISPIVPQNMEEDSSCGCIGYFRAV
jgi:hypothetical protein